MPLLDCGACCDMGVIENDGGPDSICSCRWGQAHAAGLAADARRPAPMVGGNTAERFAHANAFLQTCEACDAETRADFDGVRCTECTWKFFY